MNKEVKEKFDSLINVLNDAGNIYQKAIKDIKEIANNISENLNDEEEWIPGDDEGYWYYDKDFELVDDDYWDDEEKDKIRLKNKVIFKTEEEAQRYADYMKAKEEYSYEFSKEEWENDCITKYQIVYDYYENIIKVNTNWIYQDLSHLYFKTKDQAQEFIDKYKAEILEFEFAIKE